MKERGGKDETQSAECLLVGFNLPQPSRAVQELIQSYDIPVVSSNIIYKLMDNVKGIVSGMLAPTVTTEVIGEAQVLKVCI